MILKQLIATSPPLEIYLRDDPLPRVYLVRFLSVSGLESWVGY